MSKLVIIQFPGEMVPFSIIYCDEVIEHKYSLILIKDSNVLSFNNYSCYDIYENFDEEILINAILKFKKSIDGICNE